ncbi:carbonic anhydrase family protein [Paenibacillus tarimensis]
MLNALLPKDKKSFRYNGSLTTHPCSEGVKWIVMEQPNRNVQRTD